MTYNHTDSGNAELFADLTRGDWRFDHPRGKWFHWTGTLWQLDSTREVGTVAVEALRKQFERARRSKDENTRECALKWYRMSENRPGVRAMLDMAGAHPRIALRGDEWDRNPWLLGVQNGALDLQSGRLIAVSRDQFVSMQASVPFYHERSQCPRWKRFLLEVFDHDPIMVSYIQRAVGYSLTGDSREQCFFLCWGGGRNGKSTLLEVLKHVLGTYSLVLPFTSFIVKSASVIPNDLALLPGKRFVVAKESPKAATLDEAMIKQLTGSDHISARFLHREFFEFKPVAKIWLAANHKPLIRDETNSIWRRVHLIPFTQRFEGEKCDETLTDKLIAESAGILAWAVEGCALWQASGLQPPETVLNARSEYREESDPVGRFLAEACEIGEGYSVPVAQVREAYQSWAGDNGEMAASYWECSNRLKSRGFVSKEIGHEKVRHWLGFRLKNGACRGYDAGVFAGMPEPTQPAAL